MSLDLSFPRRPYVEWYLDGDWRDITSDVRQGSISITRGRKDEQAKTSPSKCAFVLDDGPDHGDGDYSPRNPLGQWHGQLQRNVPVRVGLEVGQDDFDRTEASGWGTSPENGDWTQEGDGTTSVSSGEARHSLAAVNDEHVSYLADIDVSDCEMAVTVTLDDITDVSGADLYTSLVFKGTSVDPDDYVEVRVMWADGMDMYVYDSNVEVETESGIGVFSGQTWRFRAHREGRTIRGKVWDVTDPEPLEWTIEAFTDAPGSSGSGFVGIRSAVGSSNSNDKPILFRYDDFEIRLPRFAGEVARLTPSSNLVHTDRTVDVECGGLLRRIARYQKTLQSPVRRYLDTTTDITALDYWPLEDPPTATVLGANARGGQPALFTRGVGASSEPLGGVKWGVEAPLSVVSAAELTNGGMLSFPVRPHDDLESTWSVAWAQRVSADTGTRVWLRTGATVVSETDISFIFYTDGTWEVYLLEVPAVLLFFGDFGDFGLDDQWHTITFTAHDDGGGVTDYAIVVDGLGLTSTSRVGTSFSALTRVEFQPPTNTTEPSAVSHMVVFPEGLEDLSDNDAYHEAFFGHVGETAANRFTRLCTEEGISFSYTGDRDVSPGMGPQRPVAALELLQECVTVDQGSLYEPRSLPALGIRTTRSIIEQSNVVTLDYSAGEVAPPFGPTDDDQNTVNDVTAKTLDGQEFQFEKLTGALNVNDPGSEDGAAGRTDATVTTNVEKATGLVDQAGWRVHLGTVDEPRFPGINVDLGADAITNALATQILDANVDDFLTVTGAADARLYDDVRQIVRGYTETFDTAYRHTIEFTTSPASPYDTAELDNDALRLDSDNTVLWADPPLNTTATSFWTLSDGELIWTTDPAEFPFDIVMGGERMTATAITDISATVQEWTVTRSVNGVIKSHADGIPVHLAAPIYLAPGGD